MYVFSSVHLSKRQILLVLKNDILKNEGFSLYYIDRKAKTLMRSSRGIVFCFFFCFFFFVFSRRHIEIFFSHFSPANRI